MMYARYAAFLLAMLLCLPLASYAQWTNEPVGSSTVLDCNFSSTPGACGIQDIYSSAIRDSDGTAPVSPSGVIRSTIYAGNKTGGMQLNYVTSQVYNEMYMGLMWRTNSQFFGRQVANKLFFLRGPAANGFFGMMGGPGGGNDAGAPSYVMFGPNSGNVDNSHACGGGGFTCFPNVGNGRVVPAGTWFKIEVYMKRATNFTSRDGIVRWWVNGVLAGNYTNLNTNPNGLNEWVWSETWDGTVNPVPSVDWSHYIDHLYISIPNCPSGCVPTGGTNPFPGAPTAPVLESVTPQ